MTGDSNNIAFGQGINFYSVLGLPRSALHRIPQNPDADLFPESVSSFLLRLAVHHVTPVSAVIDRLILPGTGIQLAHPFLHAVKDVHTVNGAGPYAQAFLASLKQLLLPLNEPPPANFVFLMPLIGQTTRNLQARHLRWCPDCLMDWADRDVPLFYPLYWFAAPVQVCIRHHRPLQEHCRVCTRTNPILSCNTTVGQCRYCGSELAESRTNLTPSVTERQLWVATSINQLISACHTQPELIDPDRWRYFLAWVIAAYGGGSMAKAERRLGLGNTLLKRWRGRNRPEFAAWVELCYRCRIAPFEIFNPVSTAEHWAVEGEAVRPQGRPELSGRTRPPETVRTVLEQMVAEGRGKSVKMLARQLHRSPSYLRQYFSDLIQPLAMRAEQLRDDDCRQREAVLEQAIQTALTAAYRDGIPLSIRSLQKLLRGHSGHKRISVAMIEDLLAQGRLGDEKRHQMEENDGAVAETIPPNEDIGGVRAQ